MKQARVYIAILFLLIAAGSFWYAFQAGVFDRISNNAGEVTQIKIGGPFELTNQFGETARDSDFHGQYMLIFFGYTYCPDVCPTTLTTISTALDSLGDAASGIAPIFVSVDPDRDTPEYLKDYLTHFHPAIQGLTGTKDQIKQITKSYGVYYAKVQEDGGTNENTDDYLMDHTAITFLMDPDGQYVAHFSHTAGADAMAEKIAGILAASGG
ncbi:MAG: SCO family protein [Rhodospirillales bacterium]|nr:SCO family protein [Rhodospirillales bacterium]